MKNLLHSVQTKGGGSKAILTMLKKMDNWHTSAAQKIKKLSETPVTVHNIAKLCVIDGKNREITKKLVQPVPPHPCWTHGNFNGKMTKKIKWPKITFPGSKMVPKVTKWGF